MEPPYSITVDAEPIYPATVPAGGGIEVFDTPEAFELNRARMDHLRSLDLPLRGKRVLDVGCGVGHLARLFIEQDCAVLCVDAREENIRRLKACHADLEARVFDLEKPVLDLDHFDIAWVNDLTDSRDGHLLRYTFVASRSPLLNPSLVSLLDANKMA